MLHTVSSVVLERKNTGKGGIWCARSLSSSRGSSPVRIPAKEIELDRVKTRDLMGPRFPSKFCNRLDVPRWKSSDNEVHSAHRHAPANTDRPQLRLVTILFPSAIRALAPVPLTSPAQSPSPPRSLLAPSTSLPSLFALVLAGAMRLRQRKGGMKSTRVGEVLLKEMLRLWSTRAQESDTAERWDLDTKTQELEDIELRTIPYLAAGKRWVGVTWSWRTQADDGTRAVNKPGMEHRSHKRGGDRRRRDAGGASGGGSVLAGRMVVGGEKSEVKIDFDLMPRKLAKKPMDIGIDGNGNANGNAGNPNGTESACAREQHIDNPASVTGKRYGNKNENKHEHARTDNDADTRHRVRERAGKCMGTGLGTGARERVRAANGKVYWYRRRRRTGTGAGSTWERERVRAAYRHGYGLNGASGLQVRERDTGSVRALGRARCWNLCLAFLVLQIGVQKSESDSEIRKPLNSLDDPVSPLSFQLIIDIPCVARVSASTQVDAERSKQTLGSYCSRSLGAGRLQQTDGVSMGTTPQDSYLQTQERAEGQAGFHYPFTCLLKKPFSANTLEHISLFSHGYAIRIDGVPGGDQLQNFAQAEAEAELYLPFPSTNSPVRGLPAGLITSVKGISQFGGGGGSPILLR
ncbi:hypothetical protein R3P38DRAFT_2793025 [Favolaschia claudopus]|uniref:Uncharacterized protein n=1 Tax=Favolaschia claudopus TaxID=2862362 RepID=A0AAW0AEP9_9AGAR